MLIIICCRANKILRATGDWASINKLRRLHRLHQDSDSEPDGHQSRPNTTSFSGQDNQRRHLNSNYDDNLYYYYSVVSALLAAAGFGPSFPPPFY